jgi:hypothetical protein
MDGWNHDRRFEGIPKPILQEKHRSDNQIRQIRIPQNVRSPLPPKTLGVLHRRRKKVAQHKRKGRGVLKGRMKIVGDIISPIDVEWEALK